MNKNSSKIKRQIEIDIDDEVDEFLNSKRDVIRDFLEASDYGLALCDRAFACAHKNRSKFNCDSFTPRRFFVYNCDGINYKATLSSRIHCGYDVCSKLTSF